MPTSQPCAPSSSKNTPTLLIIPSPADITSSATKVAGITAAATGTRRPPSPGQPVRDHLPPRSSQPQGQHRADDREAGQPPTAPPAVGLLQVAQRTLADAQRNSDHPRIAGDREQPRHRDRHAGRPPAGDIRPPARRGPGIAPAATGTGAAGTA